MWIQNEWILQGGEWVQSDEELCLIGVKVSDAEAMASIGGWTRHQWLKTDTTIIGMPLDSNSYLIVFSKEVR